MEEKAYLLDNTVNDLNKKLIIFITHNESFFSANNSQYQAWLKKSNIFLSLKE